MKDRSRLDAATLPGAEERTMLRDSLRGLLEAAWPPAGAVERGASTKAVAAIWTQLVEQGVAALGAEPGEGGLGELAVVMEELGRAACPAPMLAAGLANLALADTPGDAVAAWLARLHDGSVRACWSFGETDFDRHAGQVRIEVEPAAAPTGARSGAAGGSVCFVDAALAATHLVAATIAPEPGLALVDLAAPTATVLETTALGVGAWSRIDLAGAPALFVPASSEVLADLQRIARIALLARAHGAARRAFEMAVDYAKERRQFGQPIGRFQAIQHKLANALIALEGVRQTVAHATESFDRGAADWRYFAAAAVAFGARRCARSRSRRSTPSAPSAMPRSTRRRATSGAAISTRSCTAARAAARRELARVPARRPQRRPLPEYDLGACRQRLSRRGPRLARGNW